MKKIIIVSLACLIFLVCNMFSAYRTTLVTEMSEKSPMGSFSGTRELEIWGLRYNPIWWEAFRP